MSARLAVGDRAGSDHAQNRSASLSLLLTLPFAAVFVAIPDTIMRAIFAHGAFDKSAAALAAVALAAYGVGLPAFALSRIVQATFYARHDTATPARVTIAALLCNIALKVIFVWGFGFGIAGVALGTALGAWINVGVLTFIGRRRELIALDGAFHRALLPVLIAAGAAAAGAYLGATALRHAQLPLKDEISLGLAIVLGSGAYGAAVLAFRRVLPLGRFAA
jgi:putative peptidoglycan lipid II flippase